MDQELYQRIQELQQAALFRKEASGGFSRVVNSPFLGGPIASAFERLTRFADSVVEIGRLGVHEVHDVCWGIDVVEDDVADMDLTKTWTIDGAITVRRMAGGRC